MSKIAAKVAFLGRSGVGKTSILLQICKGYFNPHSNSTIGASYVFKTIKTRDEKIVNIHFCDTAGQERFNSLVPTYVRGCAAIIIVCSVDDPESINCLDVWYNLAKEHNNDFILYVLQNKCDMEVEFDERVMEWADSKGGRFFKVTAKERATLEPFLERLADDMSHLNIESPEHEEAVVKEKNEEKKKCCT